MSKCGFRSNHIFKRCCLQSIKCKKVVRNFKTPNGGNEPDNVDLPQGVGRWSIYINA